MIVHADQTGVDQEFNPNKLVDACPPSANDHPSIENVDVEIAPVQAMIKHLVDRHVAVTSTLVIFETFAPDQPPVQDRVLLALSLPSRTDYLFVRSKINGGNGSGGILLKKETQFERDFVKAGGLLLSGEDPTGYGGVLAGFGDQRQVDLLVGAGFTALEAIRITTLNGADFSANRIASVRFSAERLPTSLSSTAIPARRSAISKM